ncbi:hypothetical protein SDC9_109110 [bioreactor metagenome]|uniref:Uncharacterized protein n=1 Tax=bioreactor metagenome TaxID=1076179 RepID=A0A645BKC5_9ZZZZ
MNYILEHTKDVKFYTYMPAMFDALGISAADYDWFISDIELTPRVPGFEWHDQWMTGEMLQQLIAKHDIQFVWAVFSAVPKGTRPNVESVPYCDGNSDYWTKQDLRPQLPAAFFEIACWDSAATIFIGLPEEAIARLAAKYADLKPLEDCHASE